MTLGSPPESQHRRIGGTSSSAQRKEAYQPPAKQVEAAGLPEVSKEDIIYEGTCRKLIVVDYKPKRFPKPDVTITIGEKLQFHIPGGAAGSLRDGDIIVRLPGQLVPTHFNTIEEISVDALTDAERFFIQKSENYLKDGNTPLMKISLTERKKFDTELKSIVKAGGLRLYTHNAVKGFIEGKLNKDAIGKFVIERLTNEGKELLAINPKDLKAFHDVSIHVDRLLDPHETQPTTSKERHGKASSNEPKAKNTFPNRDMVLEAAKEALAYRQIKEKTLKHEPNDDSYTVTPRNSDGLTVFGQKMQAIIDRQNAFREEVKEQKAKRDADKTRKEEEERKEREAAERKRLKLLEAKKIAQEEQRRKAESAERKAEAERLEHERREREAKRKEEARKHAEEQTRKEAAARKHAEEEQKRQKRIAYLKNGLKNGVRRQDHGEPNRPHSAEPWQSKESAKRGAASANRDADECITRRAQEAHQIARKKEAYRQKIQERKDNRKRRQSEKETDKTRQSLPKNIQSPFTDPSTYDQRRKEILERKKRRPTYARITGVVQTDSKKDLKANDNMLGNDSSRFSSNTNTTPFMQHQSALPTEPRAHRERRKRQSFSKHKPKVVGHTEPLEPKPDQKSNVKPGNKRNNRRRRSARTYRPSRKSQPTVETKEEADSTNAVIRPKEWRRPKSGHRKPRKHKLIKSKCRLTSQKKANIHQAYLNRKPLRPAPVRPLSQEQRNGSDDAAEQSDPEEAEQHHAHTVQQPQPARGFLGRLYDSAVHYAKTIKKTIQEHPKKTAFVAASIVAGSWWCLNGKKAQPKLHVPVSLPIIKEATNVVAQTVGKAAGNVVTKARVGQGLNQFSDILWKRRLAEHSSESVATAMHRRLANERRFSGRYIRDQRLLEEHRASMRRSNADHIDG